MAEILGIIAASGQFVEQSANILKLSKRVLDQIRDAPKEIESWQDELIDLQKLVDEINTSPTLQVKDLEPIIMQCKDVSNSLSGIFAQIKFESTDSFGHKTWKAIGGLAKESEIKSLFGRIERLKSNLSIRIAVIHLNQDFEGSAKSDKQLQYPQGLFQSGTPEDQCLRHLFVTDPVSDRESIVTSKGQRTKGTCEWILQDLKYQNWALAQSGLLWICGAPGKGKTVLSVFLTKVLEASRTNGTVIWFFCDNKVASRNTAVNIMRGLMIQLITRHGHLISYLMPVWNIQGGHLFGANAFESLWKIFEDMIKSLHSTEVCCVLDALDECDEQSLSPLTSKLVALFNNDSASKSHTLKLIIASREEPRWLFNTLSVFPYIRLDTLKHDIDLFISDRVAYLAKVNNIEMSPLRQHIYEVLKRNAGGTFLWVSFMCKDLERKTLNEIEEALGQLPNGLDAIYERILTQIQPQNKRVVSKILSWLSLARRPLKVIELCEAIGIEPTQHLTRELVCLGHIRSCGHLLLLSWGRIDYSNSKRPFEDLHPELHPLDSNLQSKFSPPQDPCVFVYVSFLHQSAKDFLVSHSEISTTLPLVVNKQAEHAAITTRLISCLSNLSSDLSTEPHSWLNLVNRVPLLAYAAHNWTYHMRESGDQYTSVLKDNKDFFGKASESRHIWCYHIRRRVYDLERKTVPLLHVACHEGLYHLVTHLLEGKKNWSRFWRKQEINKKSSLLKYTPLDYATQGGWEAIVELLLKYGANANVKSPLGCTPLHQAVLRGNYVLFQLLASSKGGREFIKTESRFLAVKHNNESLLHSAVRAGHTQICSDLIDKYRLDVNVLSLADNYTPLVTAISRNNLFLAHLLVERWGAKAASDMSLLTAVVRSKYYSGNMDVGYHEGLKFVTRDLGININIVDEAGDTFLHHPASLDIDLFRESIACGFDLKNCNSKGETVLHANRYLSENHEFVRLFLNQSHLNINARDNHSCTVLHSLVNDIKSYPWTFFIWFVDGYEFNLSSLFVLLDFGANRVLRDDEGQTAYESAMKARDEDSGKDSDLNLLWSRVIDILASYKTVPICIQD